VSETCKQLEKQVAVLAKELDCCRTREAELGQQLSLREQQFTWRVSEMEKSSRASVQELNKIVIAHQTISEK